MKFPRIHTGVIWLVMIGACARLTAQVATPAPAEATGAPMIDFDNKLYNFGKAAAGELVKHVYIVTNTGTSTLEITNVKPSCGCTTAGQYTRRIEPGQTGTIPIQFNSAHYSGNVAKTIDVFSNAKNQSRATLSLRGSIWKPLDVRPASAIITVQPDATNAASASVRIVNQTESDVTVSDPISSNKSFTSELKTVTPGKEYELVVTVEPPFHSGNAPATITLKTSLASVPLLSVTAIAAVQPAVQFSPAQITLIHTAGRWTTNRVFIRGNGNAALVLEEPQCSDSRIDVKIVPGPMRNMFNMLVAVPPDFEIPAGQHVQVTVKSNHPRYPLITIPILQQPHPRGLAGQYAVPPMVKRTSTNGAAPPNP
ncbi:MAG TPA: DUF1573 domain-containing protein [Candidatus Baltobacteraceae bacterium]|jgi:hypothetical protein|nr:DUF1573 domain-containing protein [Candidatus Baltobacteraceae bacterium]